MRRFVLSGTCGAALVFSGSLFAQGLSTINGTVTDSSGAVIGGANHGCRNRHRPGAQHRQQR